VASAILSGLSICVVGVVFEEAGVNDKVSVVGASSLVDGGNGLTFGVLFLVLPELEEFIGNIRISRILALFVFLHLLSYSFWPVADSHSNFCPEDHC